jgi:putative metallohydrolase (TIGR04338 family)
MLQEQEAVYQAQAVFSNWGRIFRSIDEVANYLTNVIDSEWFFNRFGVCPDIQVKEWKDRNRWAGAALRESFTLILKPGIIHESVVLHEFAHLLCGDADHGQCFVDTQLVLIRNAMGFQPYAEYRHALSETGVFNAS